jgi:hypothetical protein
MGYDGKVLGLKLDELKFVVAIQQNNDSQFFMKTKIFYEFSNFLTIFTKDFEIKIL